ncbi:hypothetical protein H0H93_006026 [Arthromyces matolae]|nr:hypothetical protein H0H93_006026 [Arthromyces matolae]
MSITATPIKLDGAMTTEGSNSPRDLETLGMNHGSRPVQSIVKRELLLRRMQDGGTYQKIAALTRTVQNIFGQREIDAKKLLNELTDLAQLLKGQSKAGKLSDDGNTKLLHTSLDSWRKQAVTLKLEDSGNVRDIVAAIASSRNIVEEALIPWPELPLIPGHDNIKNIILRLEEVLPSMQHSTSTIEIAQCFRRFKTYITGSDQMGKAVVDFLKAKLLTFSDWVKAWDETAEQRERFLTIILNCNEAMAGHGEH